ncbi:Vegetative incompatibility protein HET-E-1 [Apiospora saccharicola]
MRLLNATTFRLENVTPEFAPKYAVLSHRWTSHEISFRQIHAKPIRKKPVFNKLRKCCEIALSHGLSHVWIDTCCIDQSSSAELSEAINSMFRWYQEAEVCFAYLYDATGVQDFTESDWFNRGWTLQLIAPRAVEFYSGEWELFGDKASLTAAISAKTGIANRYLQGGDMELASVAERMSWAAERKTSRPEDIVYCLLGIFDIHMPLLYGEGEQKAFARLHSELILRTPDLSWLAWSKPATAADEQAKDHEMLRSVIAPAPSYFRNCRGIVCTDPGSIGDVITETNIGIEISLRLVKKGSQLYGLLNCQPRGDLGNVMAIPLVEYGIQYFRALHAPHLVSEEIWTQHEASRVLLSPRSRKRSSGLHEDIPYYFEKAGEHFRIVKVFPAAAWEPPGVVSTKPFDQAIPGSIRVIQLLIRNMHFVLVLWEEMAGGAQHRRHFVGDLPKSYSLACTTLDEVALAISQGTPQKWLERIRKRTNEPSVSLPDGFRLVVRLVNRKVFTEFERQRNK